MAEKAPALYILQKRIKRGRTLILERNIQAPFAPRGKGFSVLLQGQGPARAHGKGLSTSTLFHVRKRPQAPERLRTQKAS